VNQALKPAEELIRKGQLQAVHCVISHLDGPEIERLCFEIENPIKLEGSARYFRNLNPDEMEKEYQKYLTRFQGEADVKNAYAETSYHFTRALQTFALLDELPGHKTWHLEYKVTEDRFWKLSDENGKSLVPAESSKTGASAMKPISSSSYGFVKMDAFIRLPKLKS